VTQGWRATALVAQREMRETLRRKSFWIVAGLLLASSLAAMVLPEIIGGDDTPRYDVVVVDGTPVLAAALGQAVASIDGELDASVAPDAASARRQVEDDEADLGVVGGTDPRILVKAGNHDRLVGAVRQALAADALTRRLEAAGLTSAEAADLLRTPPAPVEELDPSGADRKAAAFLLAVAMYLFLVMLMTQVANGTAIEKANRVSEVLLAIVRPGALLFGKVVGIGTIGLCTVLAGAAPIVVKLAIGGDLPDGLGGALAGGGAWLVLGIALYLVLAGALGALVERPEEAGSLLAPLNVTLLAAYITGGTAPESPVARVLAYVPLTSPMVMPSRIAVGAASGAEMAVSLALGVTAIVVVARLGSVVYRRAIVRTGRRLKVREVLRSP
jgi:ABC-2 type transport system permease protein